MKTLIVPAAGKSSRFPNTRPKWLLTMPDGKLMIEHAISGILEDNIFDRIIVVCLYEHIEKYTTCEILIDLIFESLGVKIELLVLDQLTLSQPETICNAIEIMNVQGSILIKDCDNYFRFKWSSGREIGIVDLKHVGTIDPANKSYAKVDPIGIIQNIAEKEIISSKFCCGAYGFESASEFTQEVKKLNNSEDLYVSHIIYSMIMSGVEFKANAAINYEDWGTIESYKNYIQRSVVIFCDIDGVLLTNSSKFAKNGWGYEIIEKNLLALKEISDKYNVHLIVTTSRPESQKILLEKLFKEKDIKVERFIMDLPHTKRVLINDYSETNPYPTAISINLLRNSDQFGMLLSGVLGKTG
jgi:hypothetical protein